MQPPNWTRCKHEGRLGDTFQSIFAQRAAFSRPLPPGRQTGGGHSPKSRQGSDAQAARAASLPWGGVKYSLGKVSEKVSDLPCGWVIRAQARGAQLFIPSGATSIAGEQNLPSPRCQWLGTLGGQETSLLVASPFSSHWLWYSFCKGCNLVPKPQSGAEVLHPRKEGPRGREPKCWSCVIPSIPHLQDGHKNPGGG